MRKTTFVFLLFFQMVSGMHHVDSTCSLLQTRLQPSKVHITNGFDTWRNVTAAGKEQDLTRSVQYTKLIHQRCDGGHVIGTLINGWSQARAACDANPKCVGIQDMKCKSQEFKLCSVGTVVVYDFMRVRQNGPVRVCFHMKDGLQDQFQWGVDSARPSAAIDENYLGQSGQIACDAQHRGQKKDNLHNRKGKEWNLANAQKLCDDTPACGAVFDEGCDNTGNFRFCYVGFHAVKAGPNVPNSCLYTKKKTKLDPDKNKTSTNSEASTTDRQYTLHTDKQCDVHHTHWDAPYPYWKPAKAACEKDPKCSGLYDTQCNGKGFVPCSKGFTMMPTAVKGEGCVYTKPEWSPAKWTKSSTGCKCYFDESRTDCACCDNGACQCSQSIGANRCAPCNAIQKCVISEDLSDFPDLLQKISPVLLSRLNDVLDANTYEGRQSGIRAFLRAAYELPSSAAKVQAVALLDAKLNREHSANSPFEFPNEDEVEDWLTSWFLMDEVWDHASKANTRNETHIELPMIKGLLSRGALIQEKFQKCDWQKALQQYFSTQGGYGNWCGKAPPGRPGDDNQMISYGACTGNWVNKNAWGLDICRDSGFDDACSRHDQGAYTTDIFGIATKSLCKVDADFKAARVKLGIQSGFQDGMKRSEKGSIVAANCLFDMMPCMRYEEKSYWDWCSTSFGGYPCKKTTVGYITHWPMGNYSQFKDSACGPPGCYSESKTNAKEAISAQ
eukprot:gnl/MRDRNA2_/MRDRNA2_82119_c0_seq1.p1 gnl/MRDRNA2_/MRDRNA2_82119_c0~~gnl/MRDRNA2_/MRDRNA2_82119_c0_seq1.p1  ORF type:complete len:725 (+),score=75.66 gnl/MRDRNA2_/MRDRNA2_82119_c0_seq1:99-2273(+)